MTAKGEELDVETYVSLVGNLPCSVRRTHLELGHTVVEVLGVSEAVTVGILVHGGHIEESASSDGVISDETVRAPDLQVIDPAYIPEVLL